MLLKKFLLLCCIAVAGVMALYGLDYLFKEILNNQLHFQPQFFPDNPLSFSGRVLINYVVNIFLMNFTLSLFVDPDHSAQRAMGTGILAGLLLATLLLIKSNLEIGVVLLIPMLSVQIFTVLKWGIIGVGSSLAIWLYRRWQFRYRSRDMRESFQSPVSIFQSRLH